MAENESLTPEKQLLKLIENSTSSKQEPLLQVEKAKREAKKWFSLNALKGRLSFLKTFLSGLGSSFRERSKNPLGIRHFNFLLKCLILFLSLYLGYTIVVTALELKRTSNLIFKYEGSPSSLPEPAPMLKNLSYYMDKVTARDIFNLGALPTPEEKEKESALPPEEAVSKKFSLVGIAWSDNPEAMIEDTESKRTHFVKRGRTINQDIKVVAIFKDRVVLSYEDEEFELR